MIHHPIVFAAMIVGAAIQPAEAPPAASGVHPLIGIDGYAPALRPGGTSLTNREEPGLLRRAMPQGDIRDWIAPDDPIIEHLRTGERGQVGFLFQVGADGEVLSCGIERASGNELPAGLCERMSSRMRFFPALNLEGTRVEDSFFVYLWLGHVQGQAPDRVVQHQNHSPAPPPPVRITRPTPTEESSAAISAALPPTEAAQRIRLRLVVSENGRATQCLVTTSSGEDHLDLAACQAVLALGRFEPSRDPQGRPTEGSLYGLAPSAISPITR